MFYTKKLIPEIYSNSFDFSIFTGVLDAVYNGREFMIDLVKGLHAPSYVAEENLQHLAMSFNLPYAPRELLKKYRHLIKVKGTKEAIYAAIELCGATDIVAPEVLTEPHIPYVPPAPWDPETQPQGFVYYADVANLNARLVQEMLKRLVPVITQVSVEPRAFMEPRVHITPREIRAAYVATALSEIDVQQRTFTLTAEVVEAELEPNYEQLVWKSSNSAIATVVRNTETAKDKEGNDVTIYLPTATLTILDKTADTGITITATYTDGWNRTEYDVISVIATREAPLPTP